MSSTLFISTKLTKSSVYCQVPFDQKGVYIIQFRISRHAFVRNGNSCSIRAWRDRYGLTEVVHFPELFSH
jgi:hypothetical protein